MISRSDGSSSKVAGTAFAMAPTAPTAGSANPAESVPTREARIAMAARIAPNWPAFIRLDDRLSEELAMSPAY